MGALLRYIVTERRRQLLAVVGEKLCIVRSARNGDVGHAAVEQILSDQLGVHLNQDTVSSLSLAGVAGHCIATVRSTAGLTVRHTLSPKRPTDASLRGRAS